MLNRLDRPDAAATMADTWLLQFWLDFERRFLQLLSYQFRKFSPVLALEILSNPAGRIAENSLSCRGVLTTSELHEAFTSYDLRRLDAYSRNMVDYHVILDLIPATTMHYFLRRLPRSTEVALESGENEDENEENDDEKEGKEGNSAVSASKKRRNVASMLPSVQLSAVQSAVMVGIGLQRKTVEELEAEIGLPVGQVLALFNKSVRKFSQFYGALLQAEADTEMQQESAAKSAFNATPRSEKRRKTTGGQEVDDAWAPLEETIDQDLADTDEETLKKLREQQRAMLQSVNLAQFSIGGKEEDWEKAIGASKGKNVASISVANPANNRAKNASRRAAAEVEEAERAMEKSRGKVKVLKRHK